MNKHTLSGHEIEAVERYFGGDRDLFMLYRDAARMNFPRDVEVGDAAVASRDLSAIRRTAHSLRSVLESLGHAGTAQQAQALERASLQTDWSSVERLWRVVRTEIIRIVVNKG